MNDHQSALYLLMGLHFGDARGGNRNNCLVGVANCDQFHVEFSTYRIPPKHMTPGSLVAACGLRG
jgi:hypothetical protein